MESLSYSGAGSSRTDSASKTTSNHTKSPQTGDGYELSLWFDMFQKFHIAIYSRM